ncbi:MAG TPA: hypothetical protein DHU55_17380 [Blastocatellia bacterium]|jgi:hypothetical protein|nr:hypothetical protein [Blastocatellia bacterium]HAF21327.1 hypothetical protein [Blastocatellia bacterium]HCX31519.1 hypothetical protein [Blastocatellia bacterium]
MTEKVIKLIGKSARLLTVVGLLAAASSYVAAQNTKPSTPNSSMGADKGAPGDTSPFASLEEEMQAKRAIKFAEKAYQENLERARDLGTLGQAVTASFKQKNYLDREDIKNLEKAEKLVKGIRSAAGGSEDDDEMEKPPTNLAAAVKMFGKVAESLKNDVEKTPKHVVSAPVIDESNVLLELIRLLRTLTPPAGS